MKNIERIIYIVTIVILLVVIAGGATYIFMLNKSNDDIVDKDDDRDDFDSSDDSLDNVGVKFIKTNVIGNRIVQEYEISLNGKTNKLKVDFEYSTDDEWEFVNGKFNDNILYVDEESMYDDDGELDVNKNEMFNSKNLREEFNKNNFRIIKGEDNKDYLLIMTEENNLSHLLILNDDLEVINKIFDNYGVEASNDEDKKYGMVILGYNNWKIDSTNKWVKYNDQFDLCDSDDMCYPHLKVEDNKIYYLYPDLKSDFKEGDYGYLEERVYTIKDNEIHYEIVDRNKIIDASGQIP